MVVKDIEEIADATASGAWQRSGGLVLAWDRRTEPRRGFVAAGKVCPTPACPCRMVELEIREVRGGLRRVGREGDRLTLEYPDAEPAEGCRLRAELDLESGFLVAVGNDAPELRKRVQAFSDTHLLSEYRKLWEQVKGHGPSWQLEDWAWLEDSTMIPWQLVSSSNPDFLVIDGVYYAVPEYFCGEQGCTCRRVLVEVLRLDGDPHQASSPPHSELVGEFRLELDLCEAVDFVPEPGAPSSLGGEQTLRRVASAYLAAHPGLERARRRHGRIREIGPAILDLSSEQQFGPPREPARNAPKPAPNDRCPCGSGKKYKRCCGAG